MVGFEKDEILSRLKVLHDKMENEGLYVSANTAWLASELIAEQARTIEELENKILQINS